MKLPKFRNPFKRGDKVADTQKLKTWQDKLTNALNDWDVSKFDELEWLYRGTHEVYGNINNTSGPANIKKANNVVNICYEFIESQIDPTISQPSVTSKLDGYNEQAQMIEDSIKNDLLESDISEINDENERNTPVCGHSVMIVDWDSDFKHPLFRGKIVLRGIHPKQFVPQPNVWKVQDMEYFFVLSSITRAYAKRRYGVDLPDDGEQYPEVNSLSDTGYSTGNEKDKVTEVICWYRDKDGDVGRLVWANDAVLEDIPKYFYRRPEKCVVCGGAKGLDSLCIDCAGDKFEAKIEKTEILADDVFVPTDQQDPETGEQIFITIPAGTEVPYYIPKRYPVIVRRNVPKNFTFGGQSDVEVVRDQVDAIKKVISSVEEKIVRGGAIIKALNGHNFNLTNELYQIVRGSADQLQMLGVQTLGADISAELAFARDQYQWAKNVLGITDSFQGQPDDTAQSGRAKQIQVQQAAGRLQSKVTNKYTAFKEMFETMFEMKLAFCDEPRPYVRQKEDGTREYGEFNKYAFLVQDANGEWYYNTDFIFSSDAGAGLPKDKMFVLEKAERFLGSGAFETTPANLRFWSIMDQLHYPGAGDIKKQMQDEIEAAKQQPAPAPTTTPPQPGQIDLQQAQQIIQQLPPEMQTQFVQMLQTNPDQAMQMLQQVMQGGQPQGPPMPPQAQIPGVM